MFNTSMKQFIEVAAIVLMNVVSVVGVVAVNKIVFRGGFHWASTLMCFHFLCTWAFVSLAQKLQWFQEKRLTWPVYAKLGLAQMASVGFVNLSLKYNTVGTYQLLKFSNIMMTCIIEFLWKNKSYTPQIYAALACLVVGISVATVTQVEFSTVGLCMGLAGSVSTAVYQILNKATQSDHEVGALQLLQYEQPWTALFAAMFACVTDDVTTLPAYSPSSTMMGLILLSGIFAFGVNVSCYLIIGKTSPITYSVVGHTKTVGILLFGFFYLQEPTTARNMFGLLVAFAAILWYTHLTTGKPPAPKKTDDHVTASSEPPPQIECTTATELAPLVKRSDNEASAVPSPTPSRGDRSSTDRRAHHRQMSGADRSDR